jgi:cytosine/adenosine deaminase-related metal-dependent hydrolase
MKGVVPEHTGLIPFLQSVPRYRNAFTDEDKTQARHAAADAMWRNGIAAVGDIANTTDTQDVRLAQPGMYFHTFVEALGFTPANAGRSFGFAQATWQAFAAQATDGNRLRQSIVPHAPYSVSPALFGLIDQFPPTSIISIHNQESAAENEFYQQGTGGVCELLGSMGIDYSTFTPTGQPSLPSYLPWLSATHPLVLVHNTQSTAADVAFAHQHAPDVFWCLCPNANMYIENRLPDVAMLMEQGARICLGTDSLASNHHLCILSEMVTLHRHYPHIGWEVLLRWGTAHGAQALHLCDRVGSIKPGMKPGLVRISRMDVTEETPSVERLY